MNVVVGEENLGDAYDGIARRARDVNDLDREMVNLNLALSHFREAVRIYSAVNHVNSADRASQTIDEVEEDLRQCAIARAEAATAATTTTGSG